MNNFINNLMGKIPRSLLKRNCILEERHPIYIYIYELNMHFVSNLAYVYKFRYIYIYHVPHVLIQYESNGITMKKWRIVFYLRGITFFAT